MLPPTKTRSKKDPCAGVGTGLVPGPGAGAGVGAGEESVLAYVKCLDKNNDWVLDMDEVKDFSKDYFNAADWDKSIDFLEAYFWFMIGFKTVDELVAAGTTLLFDFSILLH